MTEERPPLTKKERMAIDRVVMPEQDPELRAINFREVNQGLTYQLALLEAQRCLECPKEYCIAGCPVSVNIPRFIRFLRDGDVAGRRQLPAGRQRAALRHRAGLPAGDPVRARVPAGQDRRAGRHRLPGALRGGLGPGARRRARARHRDSHPEVRGV